MGGLEPPEPAVAEKTRREEREEQEKHRKHREFLSRFMDGNKMVCPTYRRLWNLCNMHMEFLGAMAVCVSGYQQSRKTI